MIRRLAVSAGALGLIGVLASWTYATHVPLTVRALADVPNDALMYTGPAWTFETCNGTCVMCDATHYALTRATPFPDAFFEVSVYCNQNFPGNCAMFTGNCSSFALNDVPQLIDAGDLDALERALRQDRQHIYVAAERGAVQILNCLNEIAAHIPLTDDQLRRLTE